MKKSLCIFLVGLFVFSLGGCGRLLERSLEDVSSWDVSACVGGFSTCWELFRDNADKFEGGFVEAIGSLP